MEVQLVTVQTKDGVHYKIQHQLFVRYSQFYRTMSLDYTEEAFQLFTIESKQFDFIYEFFQLHKNDPPKPVGKVHSGVNLATIMEEQDAQLIYRIFANQPQDVKAVIDTAFYLHIEHLLRRLAAGMIATLDRQETAVLVAESKKSNLINQTEVSEEIHQKINMALFREKKDQANE